MADKALNGIRVIDFTRMLAGPYCGMLLADMGAEVIHVERPGVGDESRSFAPFIDGVGTCYLASNRNKKGITLNLKTERGIELFKELVKISDIMVENNRPGTMERFGIGYDVLSKINPGIIVTSVSGFGQSGPYSQRVAYDLVAQAMGGLMSFTGYPDSPPTRTGNAMGDFLGGLFATIGTLAALHYREKTGKGQWVDAAMVDAVIAVLENAITNYMGLGEVLQRNGSRIRGNAPYNCYEASDGWVVIGVSGDIVWPRLAKAMGREDMITDPRFSHVEARVKNVNQVDAIVGEWTSKRSTSDIVSILEKAGVPCAPVLSIDQVAQDPHVRAREMVVKVDYPGIPPVYLSGICPKLSLTPGTVDCPPPTLGQHNEEIYCGLLGLAPSELEELKAQGVI